jgi:hypothetical protein
MMHNLKFPGAVEVLDDIATYQTHVAQSLQHFAMIAERTSRAEDRFLDDLESELSPFLKKSMDFAALAAQLALKTLCEFASAPGKEDRASSLELEEAYEQFLEESSKVVWLVEELTRDVIWNSDKAVQATWPANFRLHLQALLRDKVEARICLQSRISQKDRRFPTSVDPDCIERWNNRMWAQIMRGMVWGELEDIPDELIDVPRSNCDHAEHETRYRLTLTDAGPVKGAIFQCKKCGEEFESLDSMRADAAIV